MSERTSVNGAPCVRDQAGNEWFATEEGGIYFDGEGSDDCELHGEDLRWLLAEHTVPESTPPAEAKAEEASCVHPATRFRDGKTSCVYLTDGTKVVLRRDPASKGAMWLEVVPQDVIFVASPPKPPEPR